MSAEQIASRGEPHDAHEASQRRFVMRTFPLRSRTSQGDKTARRTGFAASHEGEIVRRLSSLHAPKEVEDALAQLRAVLLEPVCARGAHAGDAGR